MLLSKGGKSALELALRRRDREDRRAEDARSSNSGRVVDRVDDSRDERATGREGERATPLPTRVRSRRSRDDGVSARPTLNVYRAYVRHAEDCDRLVATDIVQADIASSDRSAFDDESLFNDPYVARLSKIAGLSKRCVSVTIARRDVSRYWTVNKRWLAEYAANGRLGLFADAEHRPPVVLRVVDGGFARDGNRRRDAFGDPPTNVADLGRMVAEATADLKGRLRPIDVDVGVVLYDRCAVGTDETSARSKRRVVETGPRSLLYRRLYAVHALVWMYVSEILRDSNDRVMVRCEQRLRFLTRLRTVPCALLFADERVSWLFD